MGNFKLLTKFNHLCASISKLYWGLLLYDNEWGYCDSLYNVFVYMIYAGTTEEDWSCFVFSVQALIKIGEVIHLTNWGYISIYMTRVQWDDVCEYQWFKRWDCVFPADKLTESWIVKFFPFCWLMLFSALCLYIQNNWYEFLIRINVELTINFLLLGKLSLFLPPSICMLYAMIF